MEQPGQHILERTSVFLPQAGAAGTIESRFCVALPARGRTILGRQAQEILTVMLPSIVSDALFMSGRYIDAAGLLSHANCAEDQEVLRAAVVAQGGVAFVRNGAVLPRASGADDRPMPGPGVVSVLPWRRVFLAGVGRHYVTCSTTITTGGIVCSLVWCGPMLRCVWYGGLTIPPA